MKINAFYSAFAIIWCFAGLFAHADSEADRAAAIVRKKFNDPESTEIRKSFEKLVTETTPRVFELMRRIDIPLPLEALGDLKGDDEQQTTAKFLHSQIDALLLDHSTAASEGIVAARIVYFFRGSAVRLVYWSRAGEGKNMQRMVWTRRFPANMIDISKPLDTWDKPIGSSRDSIDECQALIPFFKDPMPPTALPIVAHQLASFESGIIEMITLSDDGLKYYWAIRSSPYTRDLDFEEFQKVWARIVGASETKRSEQAVPSDGHKPSNSAPSSGTTAPADAH